MRRILIDECDAGANPYIVAVLIDEDNFENFKNGLKAQACYSTDRTRVRHVDVRLASSGT